MKMNIRDKIKQEEGAIVIEATISLTTFMFLIFTILSIINIVSLQAKIGIALNATAKEISQYSYIYSMTGISEKQSTIHDEGKESAQTMNDIIDGVENVIDSIEGIANTGEDIVGDVGGSLDNMDEIKDQIQADIDKGTDSYDEIAANIEAIAKDPKAFILGVGNLIGNEGIEILKNKAIVTPLVKGFIQKHIKDYSGQSAEEYLKSKGVKNEVGSDLGGLNFEESVLFHDGSSDIVIIADYTVSVIKLLNIDIELRFKQKAWTRGWVS